MMPFTSGAASGTSDARRAWAGAPAAAILAAVLLSLHAHVSRPGGSGYSLADLPGFDAYVYAAMAERPEVFTVAPWGYRILSPTLAHTLLPTRPLRALRWTSDAALFLAALMTFAFVRRLGGRAAGALLGAAAFCLSAPVGHALGSPFTGDGLGVALEAALLTSVAAGAGLPLVLLLLSFGLMAKDLFLVLVPLAYVPLRRSLNRHAALAVTGALVLIAAGLTQALRWWWTPQIHTPHPALDSVLLADFVLDARAAGARPWILALLGGLTPLAALGALRVCARPFLRRYGYLVAIFLLVPFCAWLNVPAIRVFGFFGDVPRLHLYALPLLAPLALLALDRVWPLFDVPQQVPARGAKARAVSAALLVATALAVAFPFVTADRYRRYPLHGRREGLQVFLTCRMTLRTAEQLSRGGTVDLIRPLAGDEPKGGSTRRRWCLMEGWPDDAVFGNAEPTLGDGSGVVLVPCLRPQALTVAAQVSTPRATMLAAAINGTPLSERSLAPGSKYLQWTLPAAALFRGDNVLEFRTRDGGPVAFAALRVSAPAALP